MTFDDRERRAADARALHPVRSRTEEIPVGASGLEQALRSEAARIAPSPALRHRIVSSVRAAAEERRGAGYVVATVSPRPRRWRVAGWLAAGAAAALVLFMQLGLPGDGAVETTAAATGSALPDGPMVASTGAAGRPARFGDPIRRMLESESLSLPATIGGDPLQTEAENLLSDASRAAEGFVRSLPVPLRLVGRPQ